MIKKDSGKYERVYVMTLKDILAIYVVVTLAGFISGYTVNKAELKDCEQSLYNEVITKGEQHKK